MFKGIGGAELIDAQELRDMSLSDLARIVRRDWRKVYFGAVPYLGAMAKLDNVTDTYGMDWTASIVRYFLVNASTWRGPVAKAVKAELNRRVKGVF